MDFINIRSITVIWILVLASSNFSSSFAQVSSMTVDTAFVGGIELIKGLPKKNSQFIRQKVKDSTIFYTPDDLEGYSIKDGKDYLTLKLDENGPKYFFELLYQGRNNLYYMVNDTLPGSFYYTESNSLVAKKLDKTNYRTVLADLYSSCNQAVINAKTIPLSKNSLLRYFRKAELCEESPIQRLRYGVGVGLSINNYAYEGEIPGRLTGNSGSGLVISTTFFTPIGLKGFSLSSGVNLLLYQNNAATDIDILLYELLVDQVRLQLPIGLTYTIPKNKVSPYFRLGTSFSKVLDDNSSLIHYMFEDDAIFLDFLNTEFIPDIQLGLNLAFGAILKYNSNFSFNLETSFTSLYPISSSIGELNETQLVISLSLLY